MNKFTGAALIAAALASGSALADGHDAYVLADRPAASGTIPASSMIYALSTDSPCSLPIANAHNLKMAAIFNNRSHPERPDIGCWGVTLSPSRDEVVVVGSTGSVQGGMSLTAFVRATIDKSGNATAIGPAMTPDERQRNIDAWNKSIR